MDEEVWATYLSFGPVSPYYKVEVIELSSRIVVRIGTIIDACRVQLRAPLSH